MSEQPLMKVRARRRRLGIGFMYNALGSDLIEAHSFWDFWNGMIPERLILRGM